MRGFSNVTISAGGRQRRLIESISTPPIRIQRMLNPVSMKCGSKRYLRKLAHTKCDDYSIFSVGFMDQSIL